MGLSVPSTAQMIGASPAKGKAGDKHTSSSLSVVFCVHVLKRQVAFSDSSLRCDKTPSHTLIPHQVEHMCERRVQRKNEYVVGILCVQ